MKKDVPAPKQNDALLDAMKLIQQHVDAVAAVTGQPHVISFVGGKQSAPCCFGSGVEIIPVGPGDLENLPPELAGLISRLMRRSEPPRGSGGGH